MVFKKKLYKLNPQNESPELIKAHITRRKTRAVKITPRSNERKVREMFSKQVSSTLIGLWFLVGEHLRLGSWDLLKGWTAGGDNDIAPRMAMQMVHESALCVTGIRSRHSLCHQGFELINGLPYLVSDQGIHELLDKHTIAEALQLQLNLGQLRQINGHYKGDLLALDPHRIPTHSQRIMPKKKKLPKEPSKKVLQTFFAIDVKTGQPLGLSIGSSGKTATKASVELLEMIDKILFQPPYTKSSRLILADTEHFTIELLKYIKQKTAFDILVPAPYSVKIQKIIKELDYQKMWAGYAIAQTDYKFYEEKENFILLAERNGEIPSQYKYKAFISTTDQSAFKMLTEDYDKRWTIEEFFNFEGKMGWDRASTMNLNIRFGKMSLALIAQAAAYQFRQKLPAPYKQWTAKTLADNLFHGIDGDLKINNDTIVVTMYNVPRELNLKQHYENLPNILETEGVDPRIPWLYNLKVDFRFK